MVKLDVSKYYIERSGYGDSFQRRVKGYTNWEGNYLPNIMWYTGPFDVPSHWRTLNERKHYKKINEILSNPDVPMIITPSFFLTVQKLREREDLEKKVYQLKNEIHNMGFGFKWLRLKVKLFSTKSKSKSVRNTIGSFGVHSKDQFKKRLETVNKFSKTRKILISKNYEHIDISEFMP